MIGALNAPEIEIELPELYSEVQNLPEKGLDRDALVTLYAPGARQEFRLSDRQSTNELAFKDIIQKHLKASGIEPTTNDADDVVIQFLRSQHKDHVSKELDLTNLFERMPELQDQDNVIAEFTFSKPESGELLIPPQGLDAQVSYDGIAGVLNVKGTKEAVQQVVDSMFFFADPTKLDHFYINVEINKPYTFAQETSDIQSDAEQLPEPEPLIDTRLFVIYTPNEGFTVFERSIFSTGKTQAIESEIFVVTTISGERVTRTLGELNEEFRFFIGQNSGDDDSDVVAELRARDAETNTIAAAQATLGAVATFDLTISPFDRLATTVADDEYTGIASHWDSTDAVIGGAGNDRLEITSGNVNVTLDATQYLEFQEVEELLLFDGVHNITLGDVYYDRGLGLENDRFSIDATASLQSLIVNGSAINIATHDLLINSGGGNDTFILGAGDDQVDGGGGNDTVSYAGSTNNVTIDIAAGTATGEGTDTLTDIEAFIGGGGDDTFLMSMGNDDVDGGSAGFDLADFSSAAGPVTVNLVAGTATGDGNDSLNSIEHIIATGFDDSLTGSAANERLEGRAGVDVIDAAGGDDTVTLDFVSTATTAPVGGLVYHLDASELSSLSFSGGEVVRWDDQSASNYDATEEAGNVTSGGSINNLNALVFDGASYLDIANQNEINVGDHPERSMFISFRTGGDVNTDQVIYEQGGQTNGYNFYLSGGDLYIGAWRNNGGDFGIFHQFDVDPNTDYVAGFVFDFTTSMTFTGYLNGVAPLSTPIAQQQSSHTGTIGIGGHFGDTRLHTGGQGGNGNEFTGQVGELLFYDSALSAADITTNQNYLEQKWLGTAAPAADQANGGIGTDTLQFTNTSATTLNTVFDSVSGFETIDLTQSDFAHTLDIHDGYYAGITGNTLTVTATGNATGFTLNGDNISAPNNFTVNGSDGADIITTGAGDDTVNAAGGDDNINTGSGDDIINAGLGDDTINGGGGTDTLTFAAHTNGVNVNLDAGTATGQGTDGITGIENVIGTDLDDVITGSNEGNVLQGGQGDDTIAGDTTFTVPTSIPTGNLVAQLDASNLGSLTNAAGVVTDWQDQSTADNDGGNDFGNVISGTDTINGLNSLTFDGTGHLDIDNDGTINDGARSQHTVFVTFETGGDVNARQVVYEQGGGTNGFNIYILGGDLYVGAWSATGGTLRLFPSASIEANTTYTAGFVFDNATTNTFTGYLNGNVMGAPLATVADMPNHTGRIGIGALNNASFFHDTNNDNSNEAHFFTGEVGELLIYDDALTTAEVAELTQFQINKWHGSAGADTLDGGIGDDTLQTGANKTDIIIGGTGTDTLDIQADAFTTTLNAAGNITGVEIVDLSSDVAHNFAVEDSFFTAGTGVEGGTLAISAAGNTTGITVDGGTLSAANNLNITGSDGDDTFTLGAGDDTVVGGAGTDAVSFATATGSVNVNLNTGVATGQGTDSLTSIETVTGSNQADTITGSGADETLNGGGDNDIINAGAGTDTVNGGTGDDTISLDWNSGAAALPDPSTIGGASLVGWFDANDAATLFTDTAGTMAAGFGDTIAYWADKSTHGNHAIDDTVSTNDRPTYEANQLGTLNALDFDGNDVLDIANNALLNDVSGATVIAVYQRDAAVAGGGNRDVLFYASSNANDASGRFTLSVRDNENLSVGGRRLDSNSFQDVDGGNAAIGEQIIQTGQLDYANSDAFVNKNGVAVDTEANFQTNGNTSATDSVNVSIGAYTSSNQAFAGDIAEIIIYDSALGNPDIVALESYLAQKYNIAVPHALPPVLSDTVDGGAGTDTFSPTSGTLSLTLDGTSAIQGIEIFDLTNSDAAHNLTLSDAYYAAGAGIVGNQVQVDASGTSSGIFFDGSALGAGNTISVQGSDGNDTLRGGAGTDQISFANATGPVNVNLGLGVATGQGTDTITGFEQATGSAQGDTIQGGTGTQTLIGGAGDDMLYGGVDVTSFDITQLDGVGTSLWFDAADAATLTLAGTDVTQWNDKSGNANHVTANPGEEPSSNIDTINGLNVVTNAPSERLFTAATVGMPDEEFSFFSVVETADGSERSVLSYAVGGQSNELLIFGRRVFIDGSNTTVQAEYRDGTPQLLDARWRNSDGFLEAQLDNNFSGSNNIEAGTDLVTGGAVSIGGEQDSVGGTFDNGQDWNGNIGEVILFSNYLTDAQRELINLYLADKWSLTTANVNDDDVLQGGAGNDTLNGGLGADTLTGGTDADTFQFDSMNDSGVGAGNRDIITDFSIAEGDRIDLSNMPNFTFTASSADGTAGNGLADVVINGTAQVVWEQSGGDTFIYLDSNGDGTQELDIQLTGLHNLSATDFVF